MPTRTLAVRSISLLVLFILSHTLLCSAQDLPGILMDLSPGYDYGPASFPSELTRSGSHIYFSANESGLVEDTRLWRTDTTLEGTRMVARNKNLIGPSKLTDFNGTLFFSCNGLWKTNGTDAGTVKIADINPAAIAVVGNKLWVLVSKTNTLEFWFSNGTVAGTSMAFSVPVTNTGIREFKVIGNKVYFVLVTDYTTRPWVSDGTQEGTLLLADVPATGDFLPGLGVVFFRSGLSLWKTNGTPAGTEMVKNFSLSPARMSNLCELNGYVYFSCSLSLYKSDGTESGTVPLINFSSLPTAITSMGDALYLLLTDGQLIRTDGTQDNTTVLISALGTTDKFIVDGDRFFFLTKNVVGNAMPFGKFGFSDGTSAGTVILRDRTTHYLALLNGKICFDSPAVYYGELFVSDGIPSGTHLLKDISRVKRNTSTSLFPSSNVVCSSAGPLRTRGTKATTDYFTGATFSANYPGIWSLGSFVLFCGYHDTDNDLYRLDVEGPAVAKRVRDINPTGSSFPSDFAIVDDLTFFRAADGVHGYELWRSDGTEAETQMVKDVNPGSGTGAASSPGQIVQMNGTVYFSGNDGVNGYDLWKSDGTEVGTQVVKNFESSNSMSKLVVAGDKVFWGQGSNLYASDGSFDGTILLKTYTNSSRGYMTAFKNAMFFTFDYSSVLAFSDGTPAGTQSFGAYDGIGGIAVLDDKLLFCGRANGTGSTNNLFVSDGTVAGTQFIANVSFSSGSVANGIFYFAYDDTEHGSEIWQTDGTPEGTHLAFDIYPGPTSSSPQNLASCQDKLYFTAIDPFCGREIFVYPMEGLRESVTSYFDPGDTAARKIGNTACTLDFLTNAEGGEVRVNAYTIDPPRYRGKALKKHWEVLGLYDQDFSVHLSFGYTPSELSAAGVTEEELRLLKSEDEGLSWTEVPCDVLADVNRVKTRHPQTSLSLWAIAGSKAAIPASAWQAYE